MRAAFAAALLSLPLLVVTAAGQSNFPGWNVSYEVPSGWSVARAVGRVHTLASTTSAGVIFVGAGAYRTPDEALADLSAFFQSLGVTAVPEAPPASTTIAGLRATLTTYRSQDQTGRVVESRFITMLTPHGSGVNLLAMTTPEQFESLRATLERVAASVHASPPTVNQPAIAALSGSWMHYAGPSNTSVITGGSSHSHEEVVSFDGRGQYQWRSESSVSVSVPSGGAGRATSDSDHGTYTVIGTTLIMTGTKGRLSFDYVTDGKRIEAGGKTFLRQQ
jgi:hypothetical protein